MSRKSNWTQEMYDRLATLYPHHTNKELEVITGWCTKEMQYRAGRLGIVKSKETERKALSRVEYTVDHEQFIRENFEKYTNKELAVLLGFSLGYVRTKCHAMGLLRMKMEYWTEDQVQYLRDNFQTIGDKELAENFRFMWPKEKGWSFKHIEKKRLYLKLNRSIDELKAIKQRNLVNGRWLNKDIENRWDKAAMAKNGDIRLWKQKQDGSRMIPVIKIDGEWRHWAPWAWMQAHGPVPEGYVVTYIDDPTIISLANLECIPRKELTSRAGQKNGGQLSDNNIASYLSKKDKDLRMALRECKPLLNLKRQQLMLERSIREAGNGE